MCKDHSWPQIATEAYMTVRASCEWIWDKEGDRYRCLRPLFPERILMELFAMYTVWKMSTDFGFP